MASRELTKRMIVVGVGIPVALTAAWVGRWVLGGLLAFLAGVATWEYYRLASLGGVRAFAVPGISTSAALVLVAAAIPIFDQAAPVLWSLVLVLFLACSATVVVSRGVDGRPLAAVAVTTTAPLYTGGTLAFALFLRHFPAARRTGATPGFALLVFLLLVVWANDTVAYFAGKAWGRHPLSPVVSPGKTVEGAVAGLAGATLTSGLLTALVLREWFELPIPTWLGMAAGVVLGVAGQIGDLAKSVLKREVGVKDSGTLFPGHGGVLDRLDALFFTLPAAYSIVRLILG